MPANGLHRIRWRLVAIERIHRTAVSQFVRGLVNIQQRLVEEGLKMPVNRLCQIGWKRVAVARIHRTVCERLSKYTGK